MGTTTFSGPVVSGNGFVGAVTATTVAATGAITGASASVTGAITGASASVTGAITGASASVTGNVTADSGTAPVAGGAAAFLATSTAGLGVYFGSGAPTVSAAQGSLYLRTDGSSTSTRAYINTDGATTWTNITTAA